MLHVQRASLKEFAWRPFWTVVHRWAGLFIAVFLIVAGLTGSLLAFNAELDKLLNPSLMRVPVREQAMLSSDRLAAMIEAAYPSAYVRSISTNMAPGDVAVVDFNAKPGAEPLDFDQMFVDPYDGRVLGTRMWGAIRFDAPHLMPLIYRMHYSLLIPGQWGVWLFGIAAIVWFLDCFVGFYLTLPLSHTPSASRAASVKRRLERSWWSRWWPAWKIKTSGSPYRINFDLHRASGLWAWPVLALVAFSSIYLNLRTEVFTPIVSLFGTVTEYPTDLMKEVAPTPRDQLIGFDRALAKGLQQVPEASRDLRIDFVMHFPTYGLYRVGFRSEGVGFELFKVRMLDLFVNDRTGAFVASDGYDGSTPADKFIQWQFPIHSGQILGLTGRIVICITGLVVAMLSLTGIVIWQKKRRARLSVRSREASDMTCSSAELQYEFSSKVRQNIWLFLDAARHEVQKAGGKIAETLSRTISETQLRRALARVARTAGEIETRGNLSLREIAAVLRATLSFLLMALLVLIRRAYGRVCVTLQHLSSSLALRFRRVLQPVTSAAAKELLPAAIRDGRILRVQLIAAACGARAKIAQPQVLSRAFYRLLSRKIKHQFLTIEAKIRRRQNH